MKLGINHMQRMVSLIVLAVGCGGGGGDDGGASVEETRAQAQASCYEWSERVLTAYAPCVGWNADELEAELADGHDQCDADVAGERDECVDDLLDAFDRCGGDFDTSASCDELCPNGFCYDPCIYFCSED